MLEAQVYTDGKPHTFENELSPDLSEFPDDICYSKVGRILNDFSTYVKQIDWQGKTWFANPLYLRHTTEKNKHNMLGYGRENTALGHIAADNLDQVNQEVYNFIKKITDFICVDRPEAMLSSVMPGVITPLHTDLYNSYRRRQDITWIDNSNVHQLIRRYWIPLEDWKIGHFFQSNKKVITHWKAGEIYSGPSNHPHLAANAGVEPRYFLLVTGLITLDSLPIDKYTEVKL